MSSGISSSLFHAHCCLLAFPGKRVPERERERESQSDSTTDQSPRVSRSQTEQLVDRLETSSLSMRLRTAPLPGDESHRPCHGPNSTFSFVLLVLKSVPMAQNAETLMRLGILIPPSRSPLSSTPAHFRSCPGEDNPSGTYVLNVMTKLVSHWQSRSPWRGEEGRRLSGVPPPRKPLTSRDGFRPSTQCSSRIARHAGMAGREVAERMGGHSRARFLYSAEYAPHHMARRNL